MLNKKYASTFWRGGQCRRLCFAVLLGAPLAMLGGCTTPVTIEPPTLNNPANPDAIAAPRPPMPDTLNVETVERPEKPDDPHAGHMMH
ncbi:MAG: hypothetical protein PVF52_06260 [Granulosicoccaceae bacterium]|jgi:hypothetical protein